MRTTTYLALAFLFIFSSCKTEVKPEENLVAEKSSEIKIEEINYDGLELLLNKSNDKTYVINFGQLGVNLV